MGFTLDRKRFYHTDTREHTIYQYDYSPETGSITNGRRFIQSWEDEGRPDGMTVDADDNVWSAHWGGYRIVQYDPEGREKQRFHFPVPKVSSLTFGGENYTDIFATTAGGNRKPEEGEHAGALFHIESDVKGVPEYRSNVRCES